MRFLFSPLFGARKLAKRRESIKVLPFVAMLGMSVAGLSIPAWSAIELNDEDDFTRIARGGFGETINGIYNLAGPVLQPNLGSGRNSYSWSMGWYDADAEGPGLPSLYVGTVRDLLCPFGFDLPITEPCLQDPDALFGFDANQRAEIWRYEPSTYADYGGANGSWSRVYQSPLNGFADDPLVQAVNALIEANPGSIPPDLLGFVGYLDQLEQVPRDVGYRNQAVCQTAGDSRERLFATTSGIPGNVLYINDAGTAFEESSHEGLKANLARFIPPDFVENPELFPILEGLPNDGDIGYRGLSCLNGYLITSPASSVDSGSEDVSENAFLLGNADPAKQDGSVPDNWVPLVDFRSFPDIDFDRDGDPTNDANDCDGCGLGTATGDPSNYGAFDITVLDGEIWVAVSNRGLNSPGNVPDRGGVELWRGDATNFGFKPDGSVMGNGTGLVWNKVIDVGAGRREDAVGNAVDNALGVFGVLDGQVYLALWESGFGGGSSLAELIRIDPGSSPGDETWELLIGGGRLDYASGYGTATGEMSCDAGNKYEDLTPAVGDVPGDASDCYPSTGRNMGFGPIQALVFGSGGAPVQFDGASPANPVSGGDAVYFWRMGSHAGPTDDELYMGTLQQDSFLLPDDPLFTFGNLPQTFGFLCGGDFALGEFWEFFRANTDPDPGPLPFFLPDIYDLPDCEVNETGGMDFFKTTATQAGESWTEITTNGFSNPLNYGVRAILSVELPDAPGEPVLFVGTANPFTNAPDVPVTEGYRGGTEVFMGTDISQEPVLPAVSGLGASDKLQDEIEIIWNEVAGAVSYKIFRSTTSNLDDAQLVATVAGDASSYKDTLATPQKVLYYWVKVITDAGVSVYGLSEAGFAKSCTFFPIKSKNGNLALVCI